MKNEFNSGAQMSPQGWIAWYRDPAWGENRVIREGKHNVIFPNKEEAKDAAHAALMKHLNGNMTVETNIAPLPTSKERKFAEATKKLLGGNVPVERKARKGGERRVGA